jgi:hypothetical protein
MLRMFYKSKFNQDISKCDVSKVENMIRMFEKSYFEKNPPLWYNS